MARGDTPEGVLHLGWIIYRCQYKTVFAATEPFRRDGDPLLIRGRLRDEGTFPVARIEIQLWMEVEEPCPPVDLKLKRRQAGGLIQHGNPQVINSPRSLRQIELNRKGMVTAARHPIRWARLEPVPILILALANHEDRIAFRIGVGNVAIAKLSRGVIEGSNFPDAALGRYRGSGR